MKNLLFLSEDEKNKNIKKDFEEFKSSLKSSIMNLDLLSINHLNFRSIFEDYIAYEQNLDLEITSMKKKIRKNLKNLDILLNEEILKPFAVLNVAKVKEQDDLLSCNISISDIEENCSNLIQEAEKEDFIFFKELPKLDQITEKEIWAKNPKEDNLFLDQSIGNISELNESKIQTIDFKKLENPFEEKLKQKYKKSYLNEIRNKSPIANIFSAQTFSTKLLTLDNSTFNNYLTSEKIIRPFTKKNSNLEEINDKILHLKNLENKNLEEMNLSYSNINDNHIKMIIEIIKKNNKIKILKFDGNSISDQGVKILSQGLFHSNIKILDLNLNKLTDKCIPFLNILCINNENLEKIKISKNTIKLRQRDKIKEYFKKMGIICIV